MNQGNALRTRLVSRNSKATEPRFSESVRTTLLPKKSSPPRTTIQVPLLSDFAKREVSKAYGVLIESAGVANRSTFVIDQEGKIVYIEQGNTAIDPTGAETACSRAAHKQ